MLADGSITAEQLSAAFATVGWSPNIKYRPAKGPETVTDFSGNIQSDGKTVSTLTGTFKSSSTVQVPYIDSGDSSGGGSVTSLGQKSYSANLTSKAPNSGGGGGGKKEKKNLDTEKERYYEIE
jgi:hypothetical protein